MSGKQGFRDELGVRDLASAGQTQEPCSGSIAAVLKICKRSGDGCGMELSSARLARRGPALPVIGLLGLWSGTVVETRQEARRESVSR